MLWHRGQFLLRGAGAVGDLRGPARVPVDQAVVVSVAELAVDGEHAAAVGLAPGRLGQGEVEEHRGEPPGPRLDGQRAVVGVVAHAELAQRHRAPVEMIEQVARPLDRTGGLGGGVGGPLRRDRGGGQREGEGEGGGSAHPGTPLISETSPNR